jgi:hypothetical protein
MTQRLLLLALVLSVAACATKKYVQNLPLDSGVKAVYEAPFDKVKRSSYDALAELSYSVKEQQWDQRGEHTWVIVASQGLSAGTAGRYARIVIEKSEKEQTVYVVVESKASSRGAAAQDEDDAKAMQSRIEKRLASK